MALARTLMFLLLGAILGGSPAQGADLIVDLSRHQVSISTGFTGSDVLLFGATGGVGDVVVVVRGPVGRVVVRRKSRIAGIWVNRERAVFTGVPAFYSVAASRPLAEIVPDSVAARLEIGADRLRLRAISPGRDREAFRRALVRNKRRLGLYPAEIGRVRFLGSRLFRAEVRFPANVPTGIYTVQVYLLHDGEVIGGQTTPLAVSKVGLEAWIFESAHRHSTLYGVIAVIIALMAGWLSGTIFRRI